MKLPRYPKYKDSGMKWLGQVPEHWRHAHLRWLSKRYAGGTPDKTNLDYWTDGTIPWLNSGAVNQSVITEPSAYITDEALRKSSARWVPAGSLLIALAGQGKTKGMVAQLSFESTCNQSMAAIVPKDGVEGRFLYWWLISNYQNIRNLAGGDLRDGLNLELLGNIDCPVLSVEEQRLIASFLDNESRKIDGLIEEQQRLIELLKEKRQAVISHAVTKGLNPDAPMKPSGVKWLGTVPTHWEVYRLTTLYREIIEDGDDELAILSVSIHDGVSDRQLVEDELDRKINRSEDTSKYKRVQPGDLVYNMMRAWQGGFGTVTVPGQISPAYVVARRKRGFSSRFIELLLRTPQAIEEIRCHSYGVTDFRLRLYWDNFKIIRVALPPKDEQEMILAHIEKMNQKFDQLIEASNSSIATLQERRNALISAAVTGQIDVRNYRPQEAPAVCQ